ncbi:LAGLIDADG family homing endonuclease [Staphylococcus pseudintermedius]|nr:LAGLIDADG family homing endonuclease [Staphylococcus pseudintermedius]
MLFIGKSKYSIEDVQVILDNYDTMTYLQIAKIINNKYGIEKFTEKQIRSKARLLGLSKIKYHYNRRFFENINTKEKAYWLGFLYADGYMIKTHRNAEVSIQLQASDKNHLEKFNSSIEGNVPTTEFLSKDSIIKTTGQVVRGTQICQIRLYSLDMANDLEGLKLLQNKTYESVSPDLCYSNELNTAIVRGFFDGDGCIDKKGECHFTAYSTVFLDKVNEFLLSKNVKTTLYKETDKKHRLYIHTSSVLNFLTLLYNDDSYSYLDRKYNLAKQIIKQKKQKLMPKSPYTTVNLVNVV